DRVEQELKEEVEAYLELLIEMKIKQGLNPAEACRAALIELGGAEQVKEQVREVSMGYYLETLWQDLRYELRMLRKSRGFMMVTAVNLGLGMGADNYEKSGKIIGSDNPPIEIVGLARDSKYNFVLYIWTFQWKKRIFYGMSKEKPTESEKSEVLQGT